MIKLPYRPASSDEPRGNQRYEKLANGKLVGISIATGPTRYESHGKIENLPANGMDIICRGNMKHDS